MIPSHIEAKIIPEPMSGCYLWVGSLTSQGYGGIVRKGKLLQAHRVVYEFECGPIPEGAMICHHCDNRICVNPDHLYVGDAQSNNDDMNRRGRNKSPKGSEHHNARLTAAQATEIFYATGSLQSIADRYGIHEMSVYRIKHGCRWKCLGLTKGNTQ